MSFVIRPLVSACALAVLTASPVGAQTAPASTSIWSPANIVAGFIRSAVSYARIVADVRYGALEVNAERGEIIMRDLQVKGLRDFRECKVSIGRIGVSGITFWGGDDTRTRLNLADVSVANNCFGTNAAFIAVATGGPAILVSDLSIDAQQNAGRGNMDLAIQINSPGMARLDASAKFDYIALSLPSLLREMMDQGDDSAEVEEDGPVQPEFGWRGVLRSAHVSVSDQGLWDRARQITPPSMTDPAAFDAMVSAPEGTPLNDVQQQLAAAMKAFVADPGTITAELRPAAPISFDTTDWTSADDAFAALQPAITNAAPTPPVALIADPAALTDDRAAGLAYATGTGLPMNTERAVELLDPLQDDPEIALVLADLKAASDPAAAYRHAMTAAQAGAPGALAALDLAEGRLPIADLLDVQTATQAAPGDDMFSSVTALRDAALAYEDGTGFSRDYAMAWRLASLASATGDSAASALMARLDARFAGQPEWIVARDAASALAMQDWADRNLGATLAAR